MSYDPEYARDILGESIEDHHDIVTCPHCRASYDAKHLNSDGTCPSCDGAVTCPECRENTVAGEGAERCTNCEDAAAEADPVRCQHPIAGDEQVTCPACRDWMGLPPLAAG